MVTFFLVSIVLLPLFLSIHPIISDDYHYYLEFSEKGFFALSKELYFSWTGRMFTMVTFYLSTFTKESFYFSGIINGLAFIFLPIIIIWFLRSSNQSNRLLKLKKEEYFLYIYIFIFLWFSIPFLGECLSWRVGAGAYLSPLIIFLLFIYPFYRFFFYNEIVKSKIFFLYLLIIGLMVGLSHEQILSTGTIGIFFLFIYHYVNKKSFKRVPLYLYFGSLSFLVGSIIQVLAPGNYCRYNDTDTTAKLHIINKIISNIMAVGRSYYELFKSIIWVQVSLIFLLIILILIIKNYKKDKKNIFIFQKGTSLFWIICGLATFLPLLFVSTLGSNRVFFFQLVFFSILIFDFSYRNLKKINKSLKISKFAKYLFSMIIFIFLFDLYAGFYKIVRLNDFIKKRESYISEEKKEGKEIISVDRIKLKSHRLIFKDDIFENQNMFYNVEMAKYYQIKGIKLKPEE